MPSERSIPGSVLHSVGVRRARTEDAAAVVRLVAQTGDAFAFAGDPFALEVEDVQALAGRTSGGLFIAERLGRLCGAAAYVLEHGVAVLFRLAVQGRDTGVAAALVAAVAAQGAAVGAAVVFVRALRGRGRVEFFQSLGFAVDCEEPEPRGGGIERLVDLVKML